MIAVDPAAVGRLAARLGPAVAAWGGSLRLCRSEMRAADEYRLVLVVPDAAADEARSRKAGLEREAAAASGARSVELWILGEAECAGADTDPYLDHVLSWSEGLVGTNRGERSPAGLG